MVLHHVISHSAEGYPSLVFITEIEVQENKRGCVSLFRHRLGTDTKSLLLHSLGQSKSQGQPRFKRSGSRLKFCWEKLQSHTAKDRDKK